MTKINSIFILRLGIYSYWRQQAYENLHKCVMYDIHSTIGYFVNY